MSLKCVRCEKENDEGAAQCRFCGATLPAIPENRWSRVTGSLSAMPSFFKLLLGLLTVALIVAIPVLFVTGIAMIPGFASVLFLVVGFFVFRSLHRPVGADKAVVSSTVLAAAVGFFALMGMAVDQRGNPIYNAPLQLFCPAGSQLNHGTVISHPLPGRTDMTQDFRCINEDGGAALVLTPFHLMGVRLGEYIVLGYALFYLTGALRRNRE